MRKENIRNGARGSSQLLAHVVKILLKYKTAFPTCPTQSRYATLRG